jgi:predicted amidohydrolase
MYNAQVLLNPGGEIQAIHRKWNLKPAEREAGYQPGDRPVTLTDVKGVRTGMVICSDMAHPRTMWTLMRGRLGLILNSLADDQDEKWFVAKAHARMYDAWVVSANRVGQETGYWNGHTVISSPDGRLRAMMMDKEGYLVEELASRPDRSWLLRWMRTTWVKAPLPWHVLRHWKILKTYYE